MKNDKKLTWRNLKRRGWHGLGLCLLCGTHDKDNMHLFYSCLYAKATLQILCDCLNLQVPLFGYTEECLHWWLQRGKCRWPIPILFHWHIWCGRTKRIFEGRFLSPAEIVNFIYKDWVSIKHVKKPIKYLSKRIFPFEFQYPIGYFDGAAQHSICGCGP